jgi:hypothetical protein
MMSVDDVKYEQPPPMSRPELEESFRSGSGERVRDALISAFYTEEGSWVQDWCLKLVTHSESVARSGVAKVLGNIAVVRRDQVDLMRCLDAVKKLTKDSDERVRIVARDALEDVFHAIKLNGGS